MIGKLFFLFFYFLPWPALVKPAKKLLEKKA